jgi:hypothetical protein
LIWVVSVLLALLFGAVGAVLLVNPKQSVGQHVAEDYFVYLRGLGAALCVGAFLVLVPRVAWAGALLLALILAGVIGLLAFLGRYSETIIPALFLVSVTALAYIRRPRSPAPAPPKGESLTTSPPAPSRSPAGGATPAAR